MEEAHEAGDHEPAVGGLQRNIEPSVAHQHHADGQQREQGYAEPSGPPPTELVGVMTTGIP